MEAIRLQSYQTKYNLRQKVFEWINDKSYYFTMKKMLLTSVNQITETITNPRRKK